MKCQISEIDIDSDTEITIAMPHIQGIQPLPPRPEPVHCAVRPECVGCNHPAHGFICHFGDGTCLRYNEKPKEDNGHD